MLDIEADGIRQRIEFQEKKRQANIVAVVRNAASGLDGKEVSDHEPDPDWTARFFDCVQDVSSSDMRKIWVKILSGEIEQPGQTSLRTLDILKNMSQSDAKLFQSICDLVIDDFVFFPEGEQNRSIKLSFKDLLHLNKVGLIEFSRYLSITCQFSRDERQKFYLYHDRLLRIETKHDSINIPIPVIFLTESGKELYHISECIPQMEYLRSFSNFLRKKNCELSYALIIEKIGDGEVKHTNRFFLI